MYGHNEKIFKYITQTEKYIDIYKVNETSVIKKNMNVCIQFPPTGKKCRQGRIQINYNTEHPSNYRLIFADTMKKHLNM